MPSAYLPTDEIRPVKAGEHCLVGDEILHVDRDMPTDVKRRIYKVVGWNARLAAERELVRLVERALKNNWGPTGVDDGDMRAALAAARAQGIGGP